MSELVSRGSVTPKLVDETQNQLRAAEASLAEANAAIDSAISSVDDAKANIRKAEADLNAAASRIDVAKANLEYSKTMLSYASMKAPFDGVIVQRNVDTGHYVQPASGGTSRPLLLIARHDIVRIVVDIPETEAEFVTAGGDNPDLAKITVQGLFSRTFESTVTRTGWALDPSNRSLRTEVDIPNEGEALRLGMYVTVQVRLDQRQDVLTLPVSAIVRDADTARCCLVVSGRIKYRPLVLGFRSGDDFEIVSGLSGGESVVMARAAGLKPGQPVELLPPAP